MSDTDTISVALVGLRIRERELELEAVAVRARAAEVHDMIEMLEPPRRRVGRPRSVQTPEQMPLRVGGGQHEPEPQDAA